MHTLSSGTIGNSEDLLTYMIMYYFTYYYFYCAKLLALSISYRLEEIIPYSDDNRATLMGKSDMV